MTNNITFIPAPADQKVVFILREKFSSPGNNFCAKISSIIAWKVIYRGDGDIENLIPIPSDQESYVRAVACYLIEPDGRIVEYGTDALEYGEFYSITNLLSSWEKEGETE